MAGQTLGEVGQFANSALHTHIEIHSYGQTLTTPVPKAATQIALQQTGILPIVDKSGTVFQGSDIIAPYFYDVVQFLPDLANPGNNLKGIALSANTANPDYISNGSNGDLLQNVGGGTINMGNGCTMNYYTYLDQQGPVVTSLNGYRGFVGYPDNVGLALVSPLIATQP